MRTQNCVPKSGCLENKKLARGGSDAGPNPAQHGPLHSDHTRTHRPPGSRTRLSPVSSPVAHRRRGGSHPARGHSPSWLSPAGKSKLLLWVGPGSQVAGSRRLLTPQCTGAPGLGRTPQEKHYQPSGSRSAVAPSALTIHRSPQRLRRNAGQRRLGSRGGGARTLHRPQRGGILQHSLTGAVVSQSGLL